MLDLKWAITQRPKRDKWRSPTLNLLVDYESRSKKYPEPGKSRPVLDLSTAAKGRRTSTMKTPITLRITFTLDDYTRVMMFVRNQMFLVKYNFLLAGIFGFLFILMIGFFGRTENGLSLLSLLGLALLSGLLFGGMIFALDKLVSVPLIRRQVRKQLETARTMDLEHQIMLSEDGFEIASDLTSARTDWGTFIKAIETDQDLLLYTTVKFCQFIPKRAFTSDGDLAAARSLIGEKVGGQPRIS